MITIYTGTYKNKGFVAKTLRLTLEGDIFGLFIAFKVGMMMMMMCFLTGVVLE